MTLCRVCWQRMPHKLHSMLHKVSQALNLTNFMPSHMHAALAEEHKVVLLYICIDQSKAVHVPAGR